MLTKEGKLVHPLRRSHILLGDNQIHDLSAPLGRMWFVLDLVLPGGYLKPEDAKYMRLADGKLMKTHSRRK